VLSVTTMSVETSRQCQWDQSGSGSEPERLVEVRDTDIISA